MARPGDTRVNPQKYTLLLTAGAHSRQGPEGTKGDSMSGAVRVQVLMQPEEALRFEHYCERRGHKKSTLIARLIREHLEQEDQQAVRRAGGGQR